MWITAIFLTAPTFFYPQGHCLQPIGYQQGKLWGKMEKSIHRKFIHNQQHLWIDFEEFYRQLLMFAVMSRMLFCRVVSPSFSAISTFRMA